MSVEVGLGRGRDVVVPRRLPPSICATSPCGIERWMTSCVDVGDRRSGNVDLTGPPVDRGEHVVLADPLHGANPLSIIPDHRPAGLEIRHSQLVVGLLRVHQP